jgi:hypothetical protein
MTKLPQAPNRLTARKPLSLLVGGTGIERDDLPDLSSGRSHQMFRSEL